MGEDAYDARACRVESLHRPVVMSTLRNRLVIHQGDEPDFVSGTLLKPSEIPGVLDAEEMLHRGSGWNVTRYGAVIRAQKGKTVRWIWVRSRTPMKDVL